MSELELSNLPIELDSFLNNKIHLKFNVRLGLILIRDGKNVIFVQPRKDDSRKTWILPQTPIRNETLQEACCRGALDELGLAESDVDLKPEKVVGFIENVLPEDRQEIKNKLIIYVTIVCNKHFCFKENFENFRYTLVGNQYELWNLLKTVAEDRPEKFEIICSALKRAHEHSKLSWSPQEIIEFSRQSAVA